MSTGHSQSTCTTPLTWRIAIPNIGMELKSNVSIVWGKLLCGLCEWGCSAANVCSGNVSIYSQIEVDLIALWPLPPGDMMFEINNEYGFFNWYMYMCCFWQHIKALCMNSHKPTESTQLVWATGDKLKTSTSYYITCSSDNKEQLSGEHTSKHGGVESIPCYQQPRG